MAGTRDMICYAFRDPRRGCSEDMEKHVMDIVRCVDERWEKAFLVRKAARILGIEEEVVNDLIYIAILLHDVGKAAKEFQKRCMSSDGCTVFEKHYVYSSMLSITVGFIAKIFSSLNDLEQRCKELFIQGKGRGYDIADAYILLTVTPVLLHNYAHLGSKSFEELSAIKAIEPSDSCREAFISMAESMQSLMKSSTGVELLKAALSVFRNDMWELYSLPLLDRGILGNFTLRQEKTVAEAVVGLINMCDGRVASVNRRCRAVSG